MFPHDIKDNCIHKTADVEFTKIDSTSTPGAILRIEGYASTKERDSEGDVIMPSAFAESMLTYMKNPVVLFGHKWHDKPIGKTVDYKIDDTGLFITVDILDTAEGRDVATLVKAKVLNSFSVGFGNVTRDNDDETIITNLRLFENSVVNLGANSAALFDEAKKLNLSLKSLKLESPDGGQGKHGRSTMDPETKKAIKESDKLLKGFEGIIETQGDKVADLEKNITEQGKLIKLVEDQAGELRKGCITIDEYKTFTKKLSEDLIQIQKDIRTGRQVRKVSDDRLLFADWKSKAQEFDIALQYNDMGQPVPTMEQLAYHLFQTPVKYEGVDGERLKKLRDTNDMVLCVDAYMRRIGRGDYNIRNLKVFKMFQHLLDDYDPEFVKAMSSTASGAGDEWVPTQFSAELYELYQVKSNLESYIPHWDMPSNPAVWPIKTTNPTMYVAAEAASNNPSELTKSNFTTSNATFTATGYAVAVAVSPEFIEDSIIAVVPAVRDSIATGMVDGYESLILNGDDTATHRDTDASYSSSSPEMVEDGLRYMAIDSSNTLDTQSTTAGIGDGAATFGAGDLRGLRTKLPDAYGQNAADLVYVTTLDAYFKILSFSEMAQVGTYGAAATWATGELRVFDGSPLVVSGQMVDTYSTAGVDDGSTLRAVVCFNKTAFKIGVRRGVTIEFNNNILTQQWAFVGTQRKAFRPMTAATAHASALAVNIA